MMGQTHSLVGGTSAFIALTTAGLPMTFVVGASAVAAMSSPSPDSIEKMLGLEHRKITHRPAIQLAVIAAITYAMAMVMRPEPMPALMIGAGLAFGCVMHSVADAMTVDKNGIQLAWPISRRGYHLLPWSLRVWVGRKSTSERVFIAVWCGLVALFSYARFGNLIFA